MHKAGFRFVIPYLEGKGTCEIADAMAKFGFEVDDLDEDYISFKKNQSHPHLSPRTKDGKVYIEYELVSGYDYGDMDFKISMYNLHELIVETMGLFDIEVGNPDVMRRVDVFGYVWYNGTDEPFYLE